MKKLIASIVVISCLSLNMNATTSGKQGRVEIPLQVSYYALANYLEINFKQQEVLDFVVRDFNETQKKIFIIPDSVERNKQFQDALYYNLQCMKTILTPEQYKKYLTLINITCNNKNLSF